MSTSVAKRLSVWFTSFPNLLVVRTLSKSHALAGLRIGYAVGDPALIEALERVKNSFNSYPLDRLAIVGATAAMKDTAYLAQTRQAIMQSRVELDRRIGATRFSTCCPRSPTSSLPDTRSTTRRHLLRNCASAASSCAISGWCASTSICASRSVRTRNAQHSSRH